MTNKPKAPKVGVLRFEGWVARVEATVQSTWQLTLNGQPAGSFTSSTAAVKYARDIARKRHGNYQPLEDTLVLLNRSREGVLVPLCYQQVPDGDARAGGRGLEECATCPYRTSCTVEEVTDVVPVVAMQTVVEPEETLIARLQAKLKGMLK